MTTVTTNTSLPPIKGPLLDNLMVQADAAARAPRKSRAAARALPDITHLTAKLTLVLVTICMLVPAAGSLLG